MSYLMSTKWLRHFWFSGYHTHVRFLLPSFPTYSFSQSQCSMKGFLRKLGEGKLITVVSHWTFVLAQQVLPHHKSVYLSDGMKPRACITALCSPNVTVCAPKLSRRSDYESACYWTHGKIKRKREVQSIHSPTDKDDFIHILSVHCKERSQK